MSKFPITYNINDHIFPEFLSIFQTHPDNLVHHYWIIGINMEYGSHYGFGNLRAIETGTGITLSGCESDLVIGYYVDYAARSVALQILELIGFVNHTRIMS